MWAGGFLPMSVFSLSSRGLVPVHVCAPVSSSHTCVTWPGSAGPPAPPRARPTAPRLPCTQASALPLCILPPPLPVTTLPFICSLTFNLPPLSSPYWGGCGPPCITGEGQDTVRGSLERTRPKRRFYACEPHTPTDTREGRGIFSRSHFTRPQRLTDLEPAGRVAGRLQHPLP